jgi:hypothetical protein
MICHPADRDSGHAATARDSADECPSAVLQVLWNNVGAILG